MTVWVAGARGVVPDHRRQLKNPTLVVVTDRTELDSQLFEAFNRSQLLARDPDQRHQAQAAA